MLHYCGIWISKGRLKWHKLCNFTSVGEWKFCVFECACLPLCFSALYQWRESTEIQSLEGWGLSGISQIFDIVITSLKGIPWKSWRNRQCYSLNKPLHVSMQTPLFQLHILNTSHYIGIGLVLTVGDGSVHYSDHKWKRSWNNRWKKKEMSPEDFQITHVSGEWGCERLELTGGGRLRSKRDSEALFI